MFSSLLSTNKNEAEFKEIPMRTKSEELEEDKVKVQDLFEGEDLSALQFRYRKGKKPDVIDIEEYIKSIDFNNESEDENEETNVSGGQTGIFKKNYRMKLKDEDEDTKAAEKQFEESTNQSSHQHDDNTSKELGTNRETGPKNKRKLSCSLEEMLPSMVNSNFLLNFKEDTLNSRRNSDLIYVFEFDQVFTNDVLRTSKIFSKRNNLYLVQDQSQNGLAPIVKPKNLHTDNIEKINQFSSLTNIQVCKPLKPDFNMEVLTSQYSEDRRKTYSIPSTTDLDKDGSVLNVYVFLEKGILVGLEAYPTQDDHETFGIKRLHLYENNQKKRKMTTSSVLKARFEVLTKQEGIHSIGRFFNRIFSDEDSHAKSPMSLQEIKGVTTSDHEVYCFSHSPNENSPIRRKKGTIETDFELQNEDDDSHDGGIGSPVHRLKQQKKRQTEGIMSL